MIAHFAVALAALGAGVACGLGATVLRLRQQVRPHASLHPGEHGERRAGVARVRLPRCTLNRKGH